jgi:hypothetical protein
MRGVIPVGAFRILVWAEYTHKGSFETTALGYTSIRAVPMKKTMIVSIV